jgi:hypothetical protein
MRMGLVVHSILQVAWLLRGLRIGILVSAHHRHLKRLELSLYGCRNCTDRLYSS